MGVGKFCFGAYPSAEMKQRDGHLTYHYPSPHYEEKSSPSPSFSRISPTLVWIIVTLAAIFFISGLIHLLIRYLIKKRPSFSMIYHSNRYQDTTRPQSLQGQLQQLFHLHDSGLDQPSIDSLPVFGYRDIMGSKEPFDCAVCLSEFSFQDKLRLLPICGHAFHIDCIGTWLLSNSTCPLCRATLLGSGLSMENPFPYFNEQHSRELSEPAIMSGEVAETACNKHEVSVADNKIMTESGELENRVFSVRLGKLRSFNDDQQIEGGREQIEEGGPSLDARRCYSMGSYQYVVGDISLQVSFPEGRRISGRSARGESLSVSKVWLWTKRSKVPGSSDTPMWLPSNNASLGLSTGDTSQYL